MTFPMPFPPNLQKQDKNEIESWETKEAGRRHAWYPACENKKKEEEKERKEKEEMKAVEGW